MKWRKFLWLLLWILSLVGISFYGGAVTYGFFFALTLLPVVSLLYLIFVYFHFKIYQETQSRNMVCGQPVSYYFVLRNESFFGFASVKIRMFSDFSYIENISEDTEYELLPGDEFRYDTRILCKYRGEYEIGVKEVILTDFFGVFHFRYRVPETIHAIVLPQLIELTDISSLPQPAALSQQTLSPNKQTPDVIVRDYIRGDSLKRVHWKITARAQQLKIRPDTDEGRQSISILFDTKRYSKRMEEYLPLESKTLELLLALSLFLVKKNVQVIAYYQDSAIKSHTITSLQSFENFYMQVSGIYFQPENDFTTALEKCCHSGVFLNTGILIGILHSCNTTILQLAEQLASQGTMVLLYVITDEDPTQYLKENTPRKKVIVLPTLAELEVTL